jgi:hypothetical protein
MPPRPSWNPSEIWESGRKYIFVPLLAALAFVAGTVYQLNPNLVPVTGRAVAVTDVQIEQSVTLTAWRTHPPVSRYRPPAGPCAGLAGDSSKNFADPNADTLQGFVVHFQFTVSGFRGDCLWQELALFDGKTGKRLPTHDPEFIGVFETSKHDDDVGSWEIWVPNDVLTTTTFVARVELYDGGDGIRLAFRDSAIYCRETMQPCEAPTSSPQGSAGPSPG